MGKIAVIGAGPAGMMAAISAAQAGADVILFEKNEKAGKKLYITGKGRCNLTNACDINDFFDNVVSNSRFLYSSVYSFSNTDTMDFFENAGLRLKTERGNRVFPESDRASDVTRTLVEKMKESGVKICYDSKVTALGFENGVAVSYKQNGNDKTLDCDCVIVATGGLSYASTGSTGDGYVFAVKCGHTIIEPSPSLVALRVKEDWAGSLQGLSLRNISITLKDGNGKRIFSDFGEMLFTDKGVSGPVILSASARLSGRLPLISTDSYIYASYSSPVLSKSSIDKPVTISIDLKPALSLQQLDERLQRDFRDFANRDFRNSLSKLLPSSLIPVIVNLSGIDPFKKVNEVTREERKKLGVLLKDFRLTVSGTEGFNQAVVTSGGVNVKEIDPSTMMSKKQEGLFFAGEVIDVDAMTGGFNIQIAFSTGHLAGMSAAGYAEQKEDIK